MRYSRRIKVLKNTLSTQRVPAIFLDRDGTINIDHGYVHEISHFQFIDGVIEACCKLKAMGFALVLVTNQSGIAHGKFSEEKFMHLTEWMDWCLVNRNVDFDGIYFCPHHPEALIPQYRQACNCRKPQPGLLVQALHDLNIDMQASYVVGDRIEDLQAGIGASVGTKVLVRTGKSIKKNEKIADYVFNTLVELPEAIISRMK